MILGDGKYGTVRGRVLHDFPGIYWSGERCRYFVCRKINEKGEPLSEPDGRPKIICFRRVGGGEARAMTYQSDLLREILRLRESLDTAGAA